MHSTGYGHGVKVSIAALAAACACGPSHRDDPERWTALLGENSVFTGALTMRCGDGPEDFELSNSTLLSPLQVALALDGRVLNGRVWSLAEEQPSPPAELKGGLAGEGAELSSTLPCRRSS